MAPFAFLSLANLRMDPAELAEVIRRAQRRDAAAFDVLLTEYGTRLYGYFYRLTGSRDEADDLLQEVFVRLVRMIGDYQHDGRFEGWIFRIASNLVRDRVRRGRKLQAAGMLASPLSGDGDLLSHLADTRQAAPDAGLERAEDVDRVQRALLLLPEAEREVVLLRHFSGMSFREIAEHMGTPLGTALARGHRGLTRLRELMEAPEQRRRQG